MIDIINTGASIFEQISPHLGKFNIKICDVEMILDVPRVSDGEGGFIHGSYGSFSLEIINKKGIPVILEDFSCIAYCGEDVLQGNICCNDRDTHRKVAMRSTYDAVTSICIPPKEIKTVNIRIYSNADLSKCDRVTLSYLQGSKREEITVYECLEHAKEN